MFEGDCQEFKNKYVDFCEELRQQDSKSEAEFYMSALFAVWYNNKCRHCRYDKGMRVKCFKNLKNDTEES